MTYRFALVLLPASLLALSLLGCSSSGPDKSAPEQAATEKEGGAESQPSAGASSEGKAEEVLLEPFDAPPLAELDAKAEWVDQPVLDAMDRLRKLLAEQKPLATVEEALALKNDSDEANARILSALGRLPDEDSQVDWDVSITRHLLADVKTTNPIMISSVQDFDLSGLTGMLLLTFDWNLEFFANKDSVVSWQSSKDRMMDKIVLRDDLTWSDSHPLTAHDIVFSFKTIMNPKVPVPAVRSGTDELRWIEAYDDRTVVFFHKQALATNTQNILFPILPKHIYENTIDADPTLAESPEHVRLENEPVSSGPYKIVKRIRGQEIVLERRENYYQHEGKQVRDKPYFKQIRFRINADSNVSLLALKSGEIDELLLTPEQWMTQTGDDEFYSRNTKARGIEWTTFQFNWNLQTPFFSDVRVRKAMSYAFNHDEMLSKLCYGLYEPSNGMFHPSAWMAPKKPLPYYKQDLNKAEELLDEAGWIDHDGDGIRDKEIDGKSVPFEFSIICSSVQLRVDICSLLKENLDQIGIICNVHPMEATVLLEKLRTKEYQAAFGGWGTGADPGTLDNLWKTGEPRNYGGYSNAEVDRLFDEGKKEFDRQKRAAIYAKIDELIYADQPYTWLYCQSSFYGFNKELRGYKFSPRGPYHYSPGFMSIWRPMH